MTNKVVIVIVKYNCEIEKISGFETIVVDNSPPNTNLGFAKAANIGIRKALKMGADKILLVNPDIELTPKDVMEIGKTGDICSPILKFKRDGQWIYDFGGKVNWLIGRTTHIELKNLSKRFGSIDYVSGACVMIKKEVFKKIGFFDEQFFMYFEDVDFCLRAKRAGFTVATNTDVVVEHGLEVHKKTGNWQKMRYLLNSNLKFINKWLSFPTRIFAYGYWILLALKSISQKVP